MALKLLTDFPDEILTSVLAELPRDGSLAIISHVSHRFRALVEEYLYHSIHLHVHASDDKVGKLPLSYQHLSSFERFTRLRTHLQASPKLKSRVKALYLTVPNTLFYGEPYFEHERLMRQMPALEHVSFTPPPLHMATPIWVLPLLKSVRLNFSNVRDHYDEVGADWVTAGVPVEIMTKYLWVPSLRKLQVENVWYSLLFHRHYCLPLSRHGTSPINGLRFLGCVGGMPGSTLEAFILSIKKLKRLVLESCEELFVGRTTNPIYSSMTPMKIEILKAAHGASLEELAMASSGRGDTMLSGAAISFVDFSSLRRLSISGCLLGSHPMLPAQLEELQLQHRMGDIQGTDLMLEMRVQ